MESPTIIPHSKPFLGAEEAQAVADVIAGGHIAEGPVTAAYESELAARLGCVHGVAVSSGTAALQLALAALGVGAQDEVIVPSFVCTALYHAVAAVGAAPVPADIDPLTLNLDPEDVSGRITARTRAVVLAHMFGRASDPEPFLALGVPLIEDCAQSLGATVGGRPAGSFGHAAVVSSYATKVIATGEGGLVATPHPALAERVREIKAYDGRPIDRPRYNFKLTDVQAALGRVQLRRLDAFIRQRREIARRYRSAIGPPLGATDDPGAHIFHRYVIDGGSGAETLIRAAGRHGVRCARPVPAPLHRLRGRTGYPGAEDAWHRAVSVPIYPALTDDEVQHVISVVSGLR
jgi:dTDP-4-amino-4,6-dideoxygalactose transaminase